MESMNGLHEQGKIMTELADIRAGLAQLVCTVTDLGHRVTDLGDTLRGAGDGDGVMTRLRLVEARVTALEVASRERRGWVWGVAASVFSALATAALFYLTRGTP